MVISISCDNCQASFKVKDEHSGKKTKCPKCHGALQIPTDSRSASQPALEPSAAKPAKRNLEQEILGAFQGEIEPVKAPLSYRLGILLVTVVMVILPVIYLAIIAAVGYAVYYHAVNHADILSYGRGRGKLMVALVYLAPLVIGGILVLFMFKPLFSRPAKHRKTRSLTRKGEPLLFAFVDRICQAVGSPTPKRIDVDGEVNASASFRRGMLSMLGNDLVLTIGLPLVAGFNLRQFAGVLAHEFGHFSQGAGMRLTYIIRSISHWFTRVVYERDAWDQTLATWSEEVDLRIGWVLYLSQLFVWLTRRILWCLMMVGHAVSGLMLRQMEFDADRHEARLAGSDAFESTCRRLQVLGVATQGAHADLGNFYREGRLADNLPRLIVANLEQIPSEVYSAIDESIDQSTTGWLDTHPCDRDRIASARRENAPGIFRLEEPASILFSDFDAQSKSTTWEFYRDIFGNQLKKKDLHPIDALLERQSKQREASDALNRYMQGAFSILRPLRLTNWNVTPPANPKTCAEELRNHRDSMLKELPAYLENFAIYDQADSEVIEVHQACALFGAGFKPSAKDFKFDTSSLEKVREVRRKANSRMRQLAPRMDAFEQAVGVRLESALQLLYVEQVEANLKDALLWRGQLNNWISALRIVGEQLEPLTKVRNATAELSVLLNNLEGNENHEALIDAIRAQMKIVHMPVCEIRKALHPVTYPFDHAKGKITVAEYALEHLPASDDLGAIFEAAGALLDSIPQLYARLVGQFAQIGEAVETALGLEALPDPKGEPDTKVEAQV